VRTDYRAHRTCADGLTPISVVALSSCSVRVQVTRLMVRLTVLLRILINVSVGTSTPLSVHPATRRPRSPSPTRRALDPNRPHRRCAASIGRRSHSSSSRSPSYHSVTATRASAVTSEIASMRNCSRSRIISSCERCHCRSSSHRFTSIAAHTPIIYCSCTIVPHSYSNRHAIANSTTLSLSPRARVVHGQRICLSGWRICRHTRSCARPRPAVKLQFSFEGVRSLQKRPKTFSV
jgi:hypothetical protein